MKNKIDFKIIPGCWCNGEYKYNVQKIHDGVYSGDGRFVRTYEEAMVYIENELKERTITK